MTSRWSKAAPIPRNSKSGDINYNTVNQIGCCVVISYRSVVLLKRMPLLDRFEYIIHYWALYRNRLQGLNNESINGRAVCWRRRNFGDQLFYDPIKIISWLSRLQSRLDFVCHVWVDVGVVNNNNNTIIYLSPTFAKARQAKKVMLQCFCYY